MPLTDTDCGLDEASLLTTMDAVFAPEEAGVKLTVTEQLEPAARLEPQLLVCA